MLYDGYHVLGMHLIWWFVWIMLLVWIFAIPYKIPGQRGEIDSALEILKKRYARGEMNSEEYHIRKKNLEMA